jgi:hypothetical protein
MKIMDLILKDDDNIFQSLQQTKKEIKKYKTSLSSASQEYQQKYDNQIKEGTRKKQLLLQEGLSKGMSEKEAYEYSCTQGFVPTVYTPILNLLHFLTQEFPDVEEEMANLHGKIICEMTNSGYKDSGFDMITKNNGGIIPEVESFIYKNMDSATFQKLKKLKSLSKSPNEKEAFSAYRKCLELCNKFNLNFDKIPSY